MSSAMVSFYYDGISQPSRAVWLLLEITGTPYEPCLVNIAKGIIECLL